MKLFLDDTRILKSDDKFDVVVDSFITFKAVIDELLELEENWLEVVSLDYDLSRTDREHTGLTCLNYLLLVCVTYGLTVPEIIIHSSWYNVELKFDPVVKIYQEEIDQQIQIQYKSRP